MKQIKTITLLLIFSIFTMSSKNDSTYVIYVQEAPTLVVMAVNTKGEAMLTNQDAIAMKFPDSQTAQDFIITLNESVDFFGTRPTRPK